MDPFNIKDVLLVDCGVYPLIVIKEGALCGESSIAYQYDKLWHFPSLSSSTFFTLNLLFILQKKSKVKKDRNLSD